MRERKLPPWEEITYFNAPTATPQLAVPPGTMIAPANPQRVVLYIAQVGAGPNFVTPILPVVPGFGFQLSANQPFVVFREKDDATLCTSAWYSSTNPTGSFAVLEVILRVWPDEDRA